MPWSEAPIRTLTLPQTAGSADPRLVIGPDLPAELTAYYVAPSAIVVAIIWYSTVTNGYAYQGLLDDATGTLVYGFVRSGTVREQTRQYQIGVATVQEHIGFDAATQADVIFGANGGGGAGTFYFQSNGGISIVQGPALLYGDQLAASCAGVNAAAATDSTTSATYVSWAGGAGVASFSFVKRRADTRVRIHLSKTMDSSAAATTLQLGASIGGTDFDITTPIQEAAAAIRHCWTATRAIAGIAAGTHTIIGRWKRTAGAGTLRTFAGGDHNSIWAEEVAA